MGKLNGKIALITGGTSGIGKASAILFAKEGADVICVGRNIKHGEATVNLLNAENGSKRARFFPCDVSLESDIEILQQSVKQQYGKLDILFNNAGVFVTSSLQEITDEVWNIVYKTNLKSVIEMTKAFMPMLEISRGVILNNSSVAGLQSHIAGQKTYLYASSKAALIQFTKLCALNYSPSVRVNCLCPGITDTPIYTNRDFSRFDNIPMKRVARPEEIAKAALFLVSNDASYITGVTLPVDGGASLK
ncbi:SDR family NAD(P)-dependent oxidoreductase [Pectinatus haikarae]|uniref:NAD(P)-dependent dehydrogenase (Short-subunit alcohol dehydrogenase family) n=1 Tax=Pectinatus haikarae TaxID=349096 RepID=A0ABT9YCE6_9FIRM|nr:SDR family oxidoreductase [Pectinatus haikarae]MDQ0205140.1 NAD(P)-dependent dehydrogenase (short-subunit alcohol dehydrogenase family) [Pectinatus haikarae]